MEESNRRRLRRFGRGLAVVLGLLALLAWRRRPQKLFAEATFAALCAVLSQFVPDSFYWPERLWMPIADFLEKVNTAVLMALVYYLAVTPAALWQRLLGRDVLDERLGTADSYWKPRKNSDNPVRYERPY